MTFVFFAPWCFRGIGNFCPSLRTIYIRMWLKFQKLLKLQFPKLKKSVSKVFELFYKDIIISILYFLDFYLLIYLFKFQRQILKKSRILLIIFCFHQQKNIVSYSRFIFVILPWIEKNSNILMIVLSQNRKNFQ